MERVRTMGVLTKPDLVNENATREIITDLVLGKRNQLRLGYCIVKNRSADDQASTAAERRALEKLFFKDSKSWSFDLRTTSSYAGYPLTPLTQLNHATSRCLAH
jgi:hypothetical protein